MLRPWLVLLPLIPLGLLAPRPASAQDDLLDDFELPDAGDEEAPPPKPAPAREEEEEEESWDPDDLLGGDDRDRIGGVGQDTADIYRKHQEQFARYAPDEEIISWEQYLERYPNSLFRDRIERRVEELLEEMYKTRIGGDAAQRLDADRREIPFAQPLLLENLNPTTRLQAGFEWGLPDYMNLFADYEHQLLRELSVHAGLRRRYTGWSLEAGTHWAFVKSSRTRTIVALLGDVRLNTDAAFFALRPQIAAGRKFDRVDVQIQSGLEIDTRQYSAPKLIGGGNVTVNATDRVAVFAETQLFMKNMAWDRGGSFRFNTMSFGLKFLPDIQDARGRQLEVNVGASVPYTTNYVMYHFGSIMGQLNYYL